MKFLRLIGILGLLASPALAQETCVGDNCTDTGSLYRTITKLSVTGAIKAGGGFISGAPLQLYVQAPSNQGKDTNDCQASSNQDKHGPCATLQQAYSVATSTGVGMAGVRINVGPGTFAPLLVSGSPGGTGSGILGPTDGPAITLIGAGSTRTTIAANATVGCGPFGHAVTVSGAGAYVLLGGLTLRSSCTAGSALFLQDFANAGLVSPSSNSNSDVVFGAATAQQIHIEAHAMFQDGNLNFSVSGNAGSMFGVSQGGQLEVGSVTITCLTANANYSSATVGGADGGIIGIDATFSGCGSVTGTRFSLLRGEILNTDVITSLTYIPGDADGVYDTSASVSALGGTIVAAASFPGSRTAPTDANTSLKTSRISTITWSGFGTDSGLNTYLANDAAGVTTKQFDFTVDGRAGPGALATATQNALCYSDTSDSPYHIFATCDTGYAVSTSQLDKTNNITNAIVPGLSLTLMAGKTYLCRAHLSGTAGAGGGYSVTLVNTNSLTQTSSQFTTQAWNAATILGQGTVTTIGNTNASGAAIFTDIYIEGAIVVNVGGTINVEFAQAVSNGTTSSVFANSTLSCRPTS